MKSVGDDLLKKKTQNGQSRKFITTKRKSIRKLTQLGLTTTQIFAHSLFQLFRLSAFVRYTQLSDLTLFVYQ